LPVFRYDGFMSPRDDFGLEHSIIESGIKRDLGILELPLSKNAFRLILTGGLVFIGLAFFRVAYLNYWNGGFYAARADSNVMKSVTLPAVRGIIYDRYGKVLVQNESAYRVVLNIGMVNREKLDIEEMIYAVSPILEMSADELWAIIKKADFEKTALVTLARNAGTGQVAAIKKMENKALEIQDDYRRQYPGGPAFAHLLGYTGILQYGDLKGKSGLEKYYDDQMAGKDGERILYRTAKGEVLDEKLLEAPVHGNDLYTTIDADLQKYFYERLAGALRSLGRDIGVGIAMNPQTGEVLALVNVPSYDNNIFTDLSKKKERAQVLTAQFQPLFNRAISGTYTPGSVVKPIVALAALKEGVITPETEVFSAGFIEIPNPYNPDQPSRFLDWKAHGWVDVRSALARSSNIFFYSAGGGFGDIKGLGIEKLKEYWKFFGFGEKTGIDTEGESIGFLPDLEEKEIRKNDIWRIGDTFNVSIGQGDLQVTPIQILAQISAIANDGKWERPFLVKDIGNESGTTTINGSETVRDFSGLSDEIYEVQEGMKDTIRKPYGTAYALSDLPFESAGKTGSSQVANNTRTNAFFTVYAPAENPQIAILVLIENAREGSLNAVPIGKDVLNWYYNNRLIIDN